MNTALYGFWSVVGKEVTQIRRDPATLVFALMIPIIQLIMFGFAIDQDVRHIPTAIVDLDRTRESRAYVQQVQNTEYLEVTRVFPSPNAAALALRQGTARVAIIIPPDFARRSVAGATPTVRVLIDGSDSQVAVPARNAFITPPSKTSGGAVDTRVDLLFNPAARTQVYTIPGLIGVILQLVLVSLTSFSLVREREQGTLEQLMVSPVGRLGLMLGKLAPYAILGLFEMIAVLILGRLVFDVHVVGSTLLLIVLTLPFLLAALALGLLISTIAQTQGQALQFTLLITLPSILLSGFVFPRETMPGPLFLLSNALPATFFLQILRGIIVRGAGMSDLWPSVFALSLITVILLTISTTRFRKSVA